MKRKDETGRRLERGVYTAEELAAVEAACGLRTYPCASAHDLTAQHWQR
jgi:hypothetical protein